MYRLTTALITGTWILWATAAVAQQEDRETLLIPDEDGMLSYEAFIPEPEYTAEVLIFRNLNTAYNRQEDWTDPELRIVLPSEVFTDELFSEPASDSVANSQIPDEEQGLSDSLAGVPIPPVDDDIASQLPPKPANCPALIDRALKMEGKAPQACLEDVVRFIPAEPTLLADAIRDLEYNADYHPLAVLAWSQPGYLRDESPSFDLRPLGAVSPAISGTISLSRGRYLHLDVDLSFDPDLDASGLDSSGVDSLDHSFVLKESRRMKRDEVHYLDHPMFGVLAIVTRYESPEETDGAADSDSVAAAGN